MAKHSGILFHFRKFLSNAEMCNVDSFNINIRGGTVVDAWIRGHANI